MSRRSRARTSVFCFSPSTDTTRASSSVCVTVADRAGSTGDAPTPTRSETREHAMSPIPASLEVSDDRGRFPTNGVAVIRTPHRATPSAVHDKTERARGDSAPSQPAAWRLSRGKAAPTRVRRPGSIASARRAIGCVALRRSLTPTLGGVAMRVPRLRRICARDPRQRVPAVQRGSAPFVPRIRGDDERDGARAARAPQAPPRARAPPRAWCRAREGSANVLAPPATRGPHEQRFNSGSVLVERRRPTEGSRRLGTTRTAPRDASRRDTSSRTVSRCPPERRIVAERISGIRVGGVGVQNGIQPAGGQRLVGSHVGGESRRRPTTTRGDARRRDAR